MRPHVYAQLLKLKDEDESIVERVERLILEAKPLTSVCV
jgi:predicted CopG family antitoxin